MFFTELLQSLQVLSMEKFEHLGFLIYVANSDPDIPAAPIPASQIHKQHDKNKELPAVKTASSLSSEQLSVNWGSGF
ncbi:hypothetical protein L2E82_31940 [Cichorium intybus]|uniref:Uncharacterized protein n=1 Tax=Cichorium intybus TaxID=13427 RepID=A0ACB9BGM5_CICIN|nr:hypothetical protein L2E82_31940 [Cichorium intybus]